MGDIEYTNIPEPFSAASAPEGETDTDFIIAQEGGSSVGDGLCETAQAPVPDTALAHARGDGTQVSVGGSQDEDLIRLSSGTDSFDGSYVMRFVPPTYVVSGMSAADILSVPSLPTYPIPDRAVDSLNSPIRASLESDPLTKFMATYDSSSQRFSRQASGWTLPNDPIKLFARLLGRTPDRPTAAIAYMFSVVDESDNDTWLRQYASSRDIAYDTARSQASEIANDLSEAEQNLFKLVFRE